MIVFIHLIGTFCATCTATVHTNAFTTIIIAMGDVTCENKTLSAMIRATLKKAVSVDKNR